MRRLYQRLAARALAAALLACSATGCRAPERSAPPPLPAATWPLATFLDSVDHRLASVDPSGWALADETGVDGSRVVRIAPGHRPEPIAPGLAASHRFAATLAGGRTLVEVDAGAGAPPALALVEAGVVRPLGAPGGRERLLGVSPDGQVIRLAREGEAGEEVVELRPPGFARRSLATLPPGFRAAAISGDGLLVALVRAVDDDADEVILLDRRTDERRLLLPTSAAGRFRPFGFDADGSALWFESDDESDVPRLERLTLANGERTVVLDRSCLDRLPFTGSASVVVETGCDGRRVARAIGGNPRWRDLRLPESLGSGARVVQASSAGPEEDWLAVTGARATRELTRLPPDRLLAPATRGLAARLDPLRLPAPEAVDPGPGASAAELWPAGPGAIGAVVWLLPVERRPDLGRFAPFAAFLASRGVATLLVVPRGAPGTGRAARVATDGDPIAATASEVARALAELRGRGAAGLPVLLVGEGAWSGAVAVAIASRPDSGFGGVVAIDPEADPLAPLDRVTAAPEPLRSRLVARWGDPADPRLAARRQELAAAATSPAVELLVVLDAGRADTADRAHALAAARAAGATVRTVVRPRPAFTLGADRRALEATWRHLRDRLAPAPATP